MFRLFANANYDILRSRKLAYGLTVLFVIVGSIPLFVRGLNESIEFTGGTVMQLRADKPEITIGAVRQALEGGGLAGTEIQTFGAPNEFVVRARLDARAEVTEETTQQTAAAVDSILTATFGAGSYLIQRTEAVGPRVGAELRTRAVLAVLMSFGATLLYLWFRFEWRSSVAAVLATVHDILTTIALMGLVNMEISLVVVAAVLTVIGYSLNDKIVVFDRVRENLHKYKRQNFYEILNRSVNETLPRTLFTGGGTLAAILSLLVFGGPVIRDFALVMFWGVVTGTFSSIYVAAPMLLYIERRWPGEDVHGARSIVAEAAAGAAKTPRPSRAPTR